ncbi:hypothetical protein Emag_003604 [Eimeria magna]
MLASCMCGVRQSLRDFFSILLLGVRCDVREIIQTDSCSLSGKGAPPRSRPSGSPGAPRGAPHVPPLLPVIRRGPPSSQSSCESYPGYTTKQEAPGKGTEEEGAPSFLEGASSRGAPRLMLEATARDSSLHQWDQRMVRQRPRKRLTGAQPTVYLL